MKSKNIVHVISCHAEGEVGDVIVGGVAVPPGNTLWEQRNFIHKDEKLRNFVLNEPRGGVFRHVNLLVPPKNSTADAAFIIMEPEDTPPMSGSNSICVTTVLLETGIIEMREPVTKLTLEAPGGLINVRAECKDGKVIKVLVENVPSFVHKLNAKLKLETLGELKVDVAFGGDSFVIVNSEELGFKIIEGEARQLAKLGMEITKAANKQIGFSHPTNSDWNHISFCLFGGPLRQLNGKVSAKSAVAIRPGKIDRSPTGTGVSARLAVLHSQGKIKKGDVFLANSIIGSSFEGKVIAEGNFGKLPYVIPEISGQAWITGTHQYFVDPSDPWPEGYRLNDTWGIS